MWKGIVGERVVVVVGWGMVSKMKEASALLPSLPWYSRLMTWENGKEKNSRLVRSSLT